MPALAPFEGGPLSHVAFIGDYLPRQCGIATFTTDIYTHLKKRYPESKAFVVAVNDKGLKYNYPAAVRFQFEEQQLQTYISAANFINAQSPEVVCLQHEYGIYGGPSGEYILTLIERLEMPVITTLHTVLNKPNEDQLRVMLRLAEISSKLVVMSRKGKEFLEDIYGIDPDQIEVIPHGIPDAPFIDPNFYKDRFSVEDKKVMLTFGLLGPNKGIENVLQAMPPIVARHPELMYLVVGATHPNLLLEQGEAYRDSLKRIVLELGLSQNVRFYNRFLDRDELMELLGAADIYITPYQNEAQITSGTLAYAYGVGKAVISTPYWHAAELLTEDTGLLVPFGDVETTSKAIEMLLTDEAYCNGLRKRAYLASREMTWENTIVRYGEAFMASHHARRQVNHYRYIAGQAQHPFRIPAPSLAHVHTLSDSTGLLQHARYDFANFDDGYCIDDNARGIILIEQLRTRGFELPGMDRLERSYVAFVNYAWHDKAGYFRNFMSYSREWLEESGSPDSNGRTIWALGTIVRNSTDLMLRKWAVKLMEVACDRLPEYHSPRAIAFSIIGLTNYLSIFKGDLHFTGLTRTLVDKLAGQMKSNKSDSWFWLENVLAYDNAKICQALLAAGSKLGRPDLVELGLTSLDWLCRQQISDIGVFSPIGSNGFASRNGQRAQFDQQPLEAYSMADACIYAFELTDETVWLRWARCALEWFFGKNDLGLPLYDAGTQGCCDALHVDRINHNQGAESTLSLQLAILAAWPHRLQLEQLDMTQNQTDFAKPTAQLESVS